jgi:four helix bundle protein
MRKYGMSAQIRRASLSVMRHLAEGQGRLSFGEWRQFLSQARGSLYEVQSDLIGATALGYLSHERYAAIDKAIGRTASPLAGLIRYVQRQEEKQRRPRKTGSPDNRTTDKPNEAAPTPPQSSP